MEIKALKSVSLIRSAGAALLMSFPARQGNGGEKDRGRSYLLELPPRQANAVRCAITIIGRRWAKGRRRRRFRSAMGRHRSQVPTMSPVSLSTVSTVLFMDH